MNAEQRKHMHDRILLLLLFAILLISCVSILLIIQLNQNRSERIPLNYLSEPVRNDQIWDSIDI